MDERNLDEVIASQIDGISKLEVGSEKRATAVKDLTDLYRTKNEIVLSQKKMDEEISSHAAEEALQKAKLRQDYISLGIQTGVSLLEAALGLLILDRAFLTEESVGCSSFLTKGLITRWCRALKK